jgi:DNA polymerase-3 subunit epsilon
MRSKILYLDVETTGLDSAKHEIVEIAFIVEVSGAVVDCYESLVRPADFDSIDPLALETNGFSLETLKLAPERAYVKQRIEEKWRKYVAGKDSRFDVCAYNAPFDLGFLNSFFERQGDFSLYSRIKRAPLDPLPVLRVLSHLGKIDLPSHKLEDVAEYFNVSLIAHHAMSDCVALREIMRQVLYALDSVKFISPTPPLVEELKGCEALDDLTKQYFPKGVSNG